MTTKAKTKQEVREFYDQIGWQMTDEGVYQNARYEDLRPVSQEYIHNCHLRVKKHLKSTGRFLLDAGSGPIQYEEYLAYSKGYEKRVCVDISTTALQEARKRIGDHGMFVVADVAKLPFKKEVFDGAVSLHTIHHIPSEEHLSAYEGIYRVLSPDSRAVVVNGAFNSPLMKVLNFPVNWRNSVVQWLRRIRNHYLLHNKKQKSTHINKHTAQWLKHTIQVKLPADVLVWRSVNVRFLRFYIHEKQGGQWLLRVLFNLEEKFPRFFGKYGAYPLVVLRKPK